MVVASRPAATSSPRVARQRVAHQLQVGDQVGGAEVVAARLVRRCRRRAGPGCWRAWPGCARSLSRYGSSALTRRNRSSISGRAARSAARLRVSSGETPAQPPGDAQLGDQRVDRRLGRADAVLVLDQQHLPGHLRGDVRVAVPVAADPGAEVSGRAVGRQVAPRAGPGSRRARRAPARPRRRAGRAGSRWRCGPRRSGRAGRAAARRSATAGPAARPGAGSGGARSACRTGGGGRLGVQLVGDRPQLGRGWSGGPPRWGGR